jgi:hypothetical protein
MKYYINDTINNKVVYLNDANEIVNYLESLVVQKFKMNRKDYMFEMVTLGHGFDDPQGMYFTELMSEYFEIGILRNDGRHIRTNVHELQRNLKYRIETGD